MLATSAPGLFCISVGASALGGALGMAGGIFIVPILTIVANVDVHLAIGASLVSVIACSCGSAGPFLKERLTNVRLAIVLETATTLGAASGVLLSGVVPVPILYAIFAAVLLVSAWQMLIAGGRPPSLMMAHRRPAGRAGLTPSIQTATSAPTWPIRWTGCRWASA
jgi:uncharacterized protein